MTIMQLFLSAGFWKFNKKEVDEWVKSGGAGDNEPGSEGDR